MAYLVLQNGTVLEGNRFGAPGKARGELVFTTGMTGYLETLTDPSHFGQIVVMTFPLIGNYGVIPADFESAGPHLSAYVVREWCDAPSNYRCEGDLDDYLKRAGVPGLWGVDTRALTKILRSAGVMNAALIDELPADLDSFCAALAGEPAIAGVADVTCAGFIPEGEGELHAAVWDFGVKNSMVRALLARGCRVTRVPAWATAAEVLALKPDGVLLSNGPGDPAANTGLIREIGVVAAAKVPMFGICLGHQMLALSQGASSAKMKFGHRGANQPARDVITNRYYITSQNHGYAISAATLPQGAVARFVNANDQTVEGIDYDYMPAFSVQFHPEACGGPLDTGFLFDQFVQAMGGAKQCR
ncbi:MAG: glutamine-hydrolyzing carbamoyl-phosphate synthase small subunit [Clostridiales bacterium]|nr:glutamine-hydrolyzing carbamoyl-phosphate synthase small subunit [Clostridiales bacterium]